MHSSEEKIKTRTDFGGGGGKEKVKAITDLCTEFIPDSVLMAVLRGSYMVPGIKPRSSTCKYTLPTVLI